MHCRYDAIFHPHLKYCIEVWGSAHINIITPVFIQQEKLLELSVIQGHWNILNKYFVNKTF